jgi:fatty-acyl-CoA synthase
VFQCAVVGVPDPKWGEVGKAFVVLKPDQTATAEALLAHLGEHLARYKIPRHVEFVTALPISAAGKVLRRALRERQ